MFSEIKIAPSILSGDFMNMASSIKLIESSGAQWIHVDVMDGHFVPNFTMGVPFVKQLRKITDLPIDVHLMISNPLVQIPWFIDAGADNITFHLESVANPEAAQAIEMIHDAGIMAAISIKPKTPVESIKPFIKDVDMVLVMSVEPGFSGQSFIEGSDNRVGQVAEICRENNVSPLIQVDGGISRNTAASVCSKGADILVCGSAFFTSDDPVNEVKTMIEIATQSQA